MPPQKPRRRRTPEEAREAILTAAEARLATHGVAGLRIADIAKDADMTHSTLLHHFGGSAELQQALSLRMANRLMEEISDTLSRDDAKRADVAEFYRSFFSTLSDKGHARLIAWLLLSADNAAPDSRGLLAETHSLLADIADTVYRRKVARGAPDTEETRKEARYIVTLTLTAAIGSGVAHLFADPLIEGDSTDFATWFAEVISGV